MPTLQFWPPHPHYLLKVGERTLTAGDHFEANEKDAEALLSDPYIREATETPKAAGKDKSSESVKQQ